MILQELIRNIVLYKGFIQPLIQVAKENMMHLYSSNSSKSSFSSQPKISTEVSFKAKLYPIKRLGPPSSTTGTLTIPNLNILTLDSLTNKHRESSMTLAMNGNTTITMLMGNKIVMIGQTDLLSDTTARGITYGSAKAGAMFTTGSLTRHTYLYFSHETHGKREYLGEFSLLHEGNIFNSLQERR